MHAALGPSSIMQYQPLLLTETRTFLQRLVKDPVDYTSHIKRYVLSTIYFILFVNLSSRYAGGMILRVIYGYEVTTNDDELLKMAEDCVSVLSNEIASTASVWACDLVPFREHHTIVTINQLIRDHTSPSHSIVDAGFGIQEEGDCMESSNGSVRTNTLLLRSEAAGKLFLHEPSQPSHFAFIQSEGNAMPSFCRTLLTGAGNKDPCHLDIVWTSNSMFSASMDTVRFDSVQICSLNLYNFIDQHRLLAIHSSHGPSSRSLSSSSSRNRSCRRTTSLARF